jgi:hypothetical protein
MTNLARQEHLDRMGLRLRAKAGGEQTITQPPEDTDNPEAHHDDKEDQFRSHVYGHSLYKVFCLIASELSDPHYSRALLLQSRIRRSFAWSVVREA